MTAIKIIICIASAGAVLYLWFALMYPASGKVKRLICKLFGHKEYNRCNYENGVESIVYIYCKRCKKYLRTYRTFAPHPNCRHHIIPFDSGVTRE